MTQKVAQKYDEIKNYYQEITNTNLEMISELKKELHKEKVDDAIQQRGVLLKVDMSQLLSINVDYIDADGD